jgi:hypothetical protein
MFPLAKNSGVVKALGPDLSHSTSMLEKFSGNSSGMESWGNQGISAGAV